MFKTTILLLLVSISTLAQNVNIPDANFKACLVSNPNIDTNGDGEVQLTEAQNFAGSINCTVLGITDTTGIEAFTSLANGVTLSGNPIGTINLSNSPNLRFFTCENCDLTNINATGLNQLEVFFIQFNDFTSFDASQFPALRELIIGYTPLTSLTLGNNNLETLVVDNTSLSSVDLSGLPALEEFWGQQNTMLQIDFSNNPNLEKVLFYQAGLENLDLTNNPAIKEIYFDQASALTGLDLSANTALEVLQLSSSPMLSELTLASGNNNVITSMNVENCTSLFCVEVDNTIDIANPPLGWILGSGTSLSYDCSIASPPINIPDSNFKACLLANAAINTNSDGEIQLSEATSFTGTIECIDMGITSTVGLEQFINVSNVYLQLNAISATDVTALDDLKQLNLRSNPLTALDVTQNSELVSLDAGYSEISELNITQNLQLSSLYLKETNLSSLDLSQNTEITYLIISDSNLTSLDVTNLPLLDNLGARRNNITSIDLTQNPEIRTLTFTGNGISAINLSQNLNLEVVDLEENNLTFVDMTNNPALRGLYLRDNALVNLNIATGTSNTVLEDMEVIDNPDLECIQVDGDIDLNNPPTGWFKDATAMYGYDCMLLGVDPVSAAVISIYPNPTTDVLYIASEILIETVAVYDVQGSILSIQKGNRVNFSDVSPGIYFLAITSAEGNVYFEKIIKQ